jgi:hypothetical protein
MQNLPMLTPRRASLGNPRPMFQGSRTTDPYLQIAGQHRRHRSGPYLHRCQIRLLHKPAIAIAAASFSGEVSLSKLPQLPTITFQPGHNLQNVAPINGAVKIDRDLVVIRNERHRRDRNRSNLRRRLTPSPVCFRCCASRSRTSEQEVVNISKK